MDSDITYNKSLRMRLIEFASLMGMSLPIIAVETFDEFADEGADTVFALWATRHRETGEVRIHWVGSLNGRKFEELNVAFGRYPESA